MTAVAAVDIGSNATRLLLHRDGAAVDRRSEVTGLGRGLARTGRLDPEAIERTAAALRGYASRAREVGVTDIRAVATAAARAAANQDDLLDAAEAALGVRPEVLSAEREAWLTFAGALTGRPPTPGLHLIVDVGGASTEFVLGTDEPKQLVSLDLGSTALTEAELPSDPPRPEELSNAIAIVHDQADDAVRALPDAQDATLIGVGGTILTMAAVELGLSLPPGVSDVSHPALDGFVLTRGAAEDVFRTLATEPMADRVHNPGLPRSRAGIIVGGCCIVVGVMRRLKAQSLVVSVADLLDGVAAEVRHS